MRPALRGLFAAQQYLATDQTELNPQQDAARALHANAQLALELGRLQDENKSLRSELDFERAYTAQTQLTYILRKEFTPSGLNIVLDRGGADGVVLDAAVTQQGSYVGKIVRVDAATSVLQLINDPAHTVSATVEGKPDVIGVVRGTRGAALLLDMVPQTAELAEGDLIVTKGIESGIPPNLYIGTITKVQKEEGELFQKAVVQAPALQSDFAQIMTTSP